MSDTPKRMNSTLPPPGDAEDLYSASTVVGPASPELLALVRAATGDGKGLFGGSPTAPAAPPSPAAPAPVSGDAKLAAMREAASRSAKEAAANEVAKAASAPPAAVPERAAPAPAAALPLRSEGPLEETMKRPSTRAAEAPGTAAGRPMPPALAIGLVFAAAALALAAIVR